MKTTKVHNARRREVVLAGLAGVSAVLAGTSGSALAQNIERAGKIDTVRKDAVSSMIPGIAKVQLRESTYQAGARTKSKMRNAMICECTQGTLEITQDNHPPFVAEVGRVWTCDVGMIEITANNGSVPATMRVFDLLKA